MHHPKPAKLKEASVSEDDFKRLQEEESVLQEKKNNANTEAEKAKISLEEFEGQLRITILDCIESPLLDMDMEEEPLKELIKVVKKVKTQVETMSGENIKKCNALDKDCRTHKKAEKDLETAQGDETEKLNSQKEEFDENKQKSILDRREELEKARRENGICQRLYDLVKGTTGKGKITLEQYIQAAGFNGIIAAANRRLLPMSDGQYELYRQEDSLGRKSNHFLDLEVLDNHTGHRRPVGNLSGGESFKASLSLALGLSDTVSSNLGGVQMDALFVDEGFGTLERVRKMLSVRCASQFVGDLRQMKEA